ncbi:MAG: hypothetical protein HY980_02665 [Candidatus Magasanikbacteria bacterium]|nr:hypothetical protein [Candidatus Magasanikbacteria bacterium]
MDEKQMLQYFSSKQDLADLKDDLKDEMRKHKDEILTLLDQQTVILNRLDQERFLEPIGWTDLKREWTRLKKISER